MAYTKALLLADNAFDSESATMTIQLRPDQARKPCAAGNKKLEGQQAGQGQGQGQGNGHVLHSAGDIAAERGGVMLRVYMSLLVLGKMTMLLHQVQRFREDTYISSAPSVSTFSPQIQYSSCFIHLLVHFLIKFAEQNFTSHEQSHLTIRQIKF